MDRAPAPAASKTPETDWLIWRWAPQIRRTIGQSQGSFNEIASYHALYFQDDFRANDKLTVNLGLRYEYELGERERNNQLTVGFAPGLTYQIPSITVGSTVQGGGTLHGGLLYAGQNGAPIHTANQSHTKFSPRVGVAYEFRKGTVLQAGFGVFYAPVGVSRVQRRIQPDQHVHGGHGRQPSPAPVAASALGSGAFLSNPFSGGAYGYHHSPVRQYTWLPHGLGGAIGSTTSAA